MKKKDIEWLKEHKPWRYDELYGDPVTGRTYDDGTDFFLAIFIAIIIIILITAVVTLIIKF